MTTSEIFTNTLELFKTNIGSHIWKMNHKDSDEDISIVYAMNSRDFLLGKKIKGKQLYDVNGQDIVYYEIENVIEQLLKGNVNYIWSVMSPIIIKEYHSALKQLRQIVSANLSKSTYNSISGIVKHNIYHFIKNGDKNSQQYQKKLNFIGRSIKFGINLLTWGKCMFQKVDIKSEKELWELKNQLDIAYKNSNLPDKPNPKPFEEYLIKFRLYKLQKDNFIKGEK